MKVRGSRRQFFVADVTSVVPAEGAGAFRLLKPQIEYEGLQARRLRAATIAFLPRRSPLAGRS
jgi:hypothetical protein